MSRFTPYLAPDQEAELSSIAKRLVTPGKGILSADESVITLGHRLKEVDVDNTEDTRRRYREVLFSCDDSIAEYISGVIMNDETTRQSDSSGTPFLKLLEKKGIIPGVKVDKGVVTIPGTNKECTTLGLDGLKERCEEYKSRGIHFAKWRCVLKISTDTPTYLAMMENANMLARFASICQQVGMVPIVEPEVLPDGDHALETTRRVTEEVLAFQFKALAEHHVFLEGMLLKPNIITAGQNHRGSQDSSEVIALATVQTVCRRVPPALAGIVFLSGGQGEEMATANLNAINKVGLLVTEFRKQQSLDLNVQLHRQIYVLT